MKRKNVIKGFEVTVIAAFLLTGCQSKTNSAETEALKQQIAQLEQQVSDLEQQAAQNNTPQKTPAGVQSDNQEQKPPETEINSSENVAEISSQPMQSQSDTSIDGLTTYTMADLSAMVESYVAKAGAATPTGTVSENMELFFALKQEEKQIDDTLDRHEDELENLYRKKTLTREEYNRLERELDLLEDKLDDMEDQLEFVFGIDD
ncbi:MAG: hypothetical protein K2M91_10110 [Lachnospiraceae bacterium]|nr:hypothetical protein [Lachnospiraceae bacterium]